MSDASSRSLPRTSFKSGTRNLIQQIAPPFIIKLIRQLRNSFSKKESNEPSLEFTTDWFSGHRQTWDQIIEDLKPTKVLEIGSWEGKSACYIVDAVSKERSLEIHCIDTWEGGEEHKNMGITQDDLTAIEARFHENLNRVIGAAKNPVSVHTHKCFSHQALSELLSSGKENYFDLIYVDGSHQATDVLVDAVLSFKLLRLGGIVVFDDYLWEQALIERKDLLHCPKIAIDSFVNIYFNKVQVIPAPLYQVYMRKIDY